MMILSKLMNTIEIRHQIEEYAESGRLGEQPIPWQSLVGELV